MLASRFNRPPWLGGDLGVVEVDEELGIVSGWHRSYVKFSGGGSSPLSRAIAVCTSKRRSRDVHRWMPGV